MTHHEATESSPVNPPIDPVAVRRLVAVTGATVLVLLLLAATDALIIYAAPLAAVALGGGLSFYVGFIARPPALQRFGRAAFVIMACAFCVTSYLGWRGKRTALGLADVIAPVPEIVRVERRPPGDELVAALALSVTLDALHGAVSRQLAGLVPDTAERSRWSRVTKKENRRYWIVETDLAIPEVLAFYTRAENLAGWTVVSERAEGLLSLQRGAEELLIMASDGFPRARSKIGYLYIGEGGDD